MYQTGLVSVSFRPLSPKEIIEATAAAGLKCIEWGSDVHAPCNDIERLQEIAKLQKESGISCSSYGTYFRIGTNAAEELPACTTVSSSSKSLSSTILNDFGFFRNSRPSFVTFKRP